MFDVRVGVFEDQIARGFQRLRLPVMLEFLEAVEHGKQAKAHRAHVQ